MEIVKLTRQNLSDVIKANQPFEIIGKIKPAFSDGIWTYTEELYDQTVLKAYPNDDIDYAAYIDDNDKAVFLAYSDEACVGQIVLKKDWNEYAFIEDICVARSARDHGVGTALIQKAAEWAKNADLKGLALETQDNNVLACRFYSKCGFTIGAVNTMLYRNFGDEAFAIFWYLRF